MSDGVVIIVSRAGPCVGLSGGGNPERMLLADLILPESLLQTPRTFFMCQPLLFLHFSNLTPLTPNLLVNSLPPYQSSQRTVIIMHIKY